MDMPEPGPVPDPREVFEQAIARGVPVHEPRGAVNRIRHRICLGHDRRGNVRFRHADEERLPVMPPDTAPETMATRHAPDRHGSDRHATGGHATRGPDGGRRNRPAMIVPFPGIPSPDAPCNGES